VKNQKANGYEYLEGAQVYFVCRPPFPWLDEEPQAGQTWIVTAGKVIAMKQGRRVIVANPQVRSDSTEAIQEEIAELEMELMFLQQELEEGAVQDDSATGRKSLLEEIYGEEKLATPASEGQGNGAADVDDDNPFAAAFRKAGLR
jgi:hypothetical protein